MFPALRAWNYYGRGTPPSALQTEEEIGVAAGRNARSASKLIAAPEVT